MSVLGEQRCRNLISELAGTNPYLLLLILGIEPRFRTQTLRRRSRGEERKFGYQGTGQLWRAFHIHSQKISCSLQCWDCTPAPTHYEGLPRLAHQWGAHSPAQKLGCQESKADSHSNFLSGQEREQQRSFPLGPREKGTAILRLLGRKRGNLIFSEVIFLVWGLGNLRAGSASDSCVLPNNWKTTQRNKKCERNLGLVGVNLFQLPSRYLWRSGRGLSAALASCQNS